MLPENVQKFFREAEKKNGAIYFAFKSDIKYLIFCDDNQNAIINAFADCPNCSNHHVENIII